MNLIKAWKENWIPQVLVSAEMKAVAERIGAGAFLYWSPVYAEKRPAAVFAPGDVFSLPGDFRCPHPEPRRHKPFTDDVYCAWCGMDIEPPKPKMGWKRHNIVAGPRFYEFLFNDVRYRSDAACGMLGFGWFAYESPDKVRTDSQMAFPPKPTDNGPWIPVGVYFWEEVK